MAWSERAHGVQKLVILQTHLIYMINYEGALSLLVLSLVLTVLSVSFRAQEIIISLVFLKVAVSLL